ncbi:hypothetical protein ElyMa_005596900 [Elysia marginata]|uniref:Uncharacterized protein n=1 Tax=Elysia marginata TaxID=1093978 RepID=A0AAV4F3Q0_9GAST|nr:hypothetical protein ElyMa_005596900 [Elysia marginata]
MFLHTRSDGNLFNLSRVISKTKVIDTHQRDALCRRCRPRHALQGKEVIQRLISCFMDTCREFSLTISLKKTNTMAHMSTPLQHHHRQIHIPRLHNLQQPVPRRRTDCQDRQKHPPPWLVCQRECGTTQC